ncbi:MULTISPECIES: hypothetical protein [Haloferax]|uniref:Uncharacterized protein n=1 Tax=Haloferax marinum TaxID=2666143 RepID=A0A6A8G6C1_9EURY|nr:MULTISPECIES: hypothetical protein [Haloferax]KAB1197562.1 hypothetical protein Hfx1150_08540 [Haloferax sp. CBA1150]MRW96611.1 hypothetical protein [Haloferax marinum]
MEPLLRLALVPGHVQAANDPVVTAIVALTGITSVALAALGVAVFYRRQTRSHLLIALALLAFASRAGVAALSFSDLLSTFDHHVFEHVLDLVMAGLVLSAIYYARTIERETGVNEP